MVFQFLCPRGHLLQADEPQAGQHCKCPYCQAEFLVPRASRDPRPDHLPVARAETPDRSPVEGDLAVPAPESPPPEETLPEIRTRTKVGADPVELKKDSFALFRRSLGILWGCVRQAPEFAARKRRLAAGR